MTRQDDREETNEQRERANRLRKQIADLTKPGSDPDRRAGESDGEYVERRMRELDRKPPRNR